jgi:two-component system chemotaxis response regulator CheY
MSLKFLIVDDSLTMRRIVINSLKNLGYEQFVEACDGKDAYEKLLNDNSLNFVITDWNMPVFSGLELTKAIRCHNDVQSIPILMVTTRGIKEDIIEALQAKVNNYIVKPFTPNVLREKIDQILANS